MSENDHDINHLRSCPHLSSVPPQVLRCLTRLCNDAGFCTSIRVYIQYSASCHSKEPPYSLTQKNSGAQTLTSHKSALCAHAPPLLLFFEGGASGTCRGQVQSFSSYCQVANTHPRQLCQHQAMQLLWSGLQVHRHSARLQNAGEVPWDRLPCSEWWWALWTAHLRPQTASWLLPAPSAACNVRRNVISCHVYGPAARHFTAQANIVLASEGIRSSWTCKWQAVPATEPAASMLVMLACVHATDVPSQAGPVYTAVGRHRAAGVRGAPKLLALLLAAGVALEPLLLHCCGVHINDCAICK